MIKAVQFPAVVGGCDDQDCEPLLAIMSMRIEVVSGPVACAYLDVHNSKHDHFVITSRSQNSTEQWGMLDQK